METGKKRSYKPAVITGIIAFPFLWFILAPFPGLGLIYSITDPLRGHPHGPHGKQPEEFVGMWMQEEPEEFGFRASAFFLMGDSTVADGPGMSFENWHVKKGTFYVDYMSRCGNGYAGNQTGKYEYEFDGADRMKLTHVIGTYDMDYSGWYQRVEVTDEFVREMEELEQSGHDAAASQARWAVFSIEDARHRGVDVPETNLSDGWN